MERGKLTEYELRIRDEIAKNLKALLKEKRMTQKDLGKLAGIPTSTISDYLNAKSLALPGNVQKMAFALKVGKEKIDPSFNEGAEPAIELNKSMIPLVGTICAGDGLLAEQNIEEYIYFPFPSNKQPDYALRVKGDSMIGAGIDNGDIVYIKRATWAEYNGQIVAAVVNDGEDGTLKRMKWTEGSPAIRLVPENEKFDALETLPNQIHICGVYMGHFKPLKGE